MCFSVQQAITTRSRAALSVSLAATKTNHHIHKRNGIETGGHMHTTHKSAAKQWVRSLGALDRQGPERNYGATNRHKALDTALTQLRTGSSADSRNSKMQCNGEYEGQHNTRVTITGWWEM